jgi:GxxExxY protein
MHALDDITGNIIDAAMRIHRELGPGLLESVYEIVLAREVERRQFRVERQRPVRIEYDGLVFEEGFRADLVVERRVVIEIKSVERLAPVHSKQLLTYLRLMHLEVGLLINFGNATLKEGLHRVVNGLSPSASPREPTALTSWRVCRWGLKITRRRGGRGESKAHPCNAMPTTAFP